MKKCIAAYLLILCFVLYTCGEAVASSIEIGGSLSASENESTLQTEVSEDAFIGMWTLSTISVDGFSMPAAYAGISLTLNIKYGKK